MSISRRFSVGIHILSLLEINKNQARANTSELIASSVNTNPAVIRKIIGMLRNADLVKTRPGIPGAELAKDLSNVTLLDVYKAVNVVKDDELFSIHDNTNTDCMVGRHIQQSVVHHLSDAQVALEQKLKSVTVDTIVNKIMNNEKHDRQEKD